MAEESPGEIAASGSWRDRLREFLRRLSATAGAGGERLAANH